MKTLIKFITLCILFVALDCKEVCYDNYGCFTNDYPFGNSSQRPISLLPQRPEVINTKFYLYNHEAKVTADLLVLNNMTSKFNPNLPTKLIVHGFFNTASKFWVIDMKNAFLNNENMNIIAVDWSGGSGLPYTQAASNTQIVGVEISILVKTLIRKFGMNANSFHCIGHSLGSHVCGYAGKRIHLGRISGMVTSIETFQLNKENCFFLRVVKIICIY